VAALIRVGIIGAGGIARAHLHGYLHHRERARVTAIADVDEASAIALASQAGSGAAVLIDYETLLHRDDVDVVSICTPNHTHAAILRAAAQHGKHILAEKPLAMDLLEARGVHDEVRQLGVRTAMGLKYRFMPGIQFIRGLLDAGELGEVLRFKAHYVNGRAPDEPTSRSWRLISAQGGRAGELGDNGPHIIDMARFLVGDIVDVVGKVTTVVKHRIDLSGEAWQPDVVDSAVAAVEFANGALGDIEASGVATGRRLDFRVEVSGSKGAAIWEYRRPSDVQLLSVVGAGRHLVNHFVTIPAPDQPYWPDNRVGNTESFVRVVGSFLDSIAEGADRSPNLTDGLRAQEIIEAIMRSSAERRAIAPAVDFAE
jgi:predicted dehydrogenase